jgi:Na+-transporting NADH:ubiquinone oxidoreductase subunit NqrD
VHSKVLAERRKIQQEIIKARRQLRELEAGKLEKIESLKATIQTHNMVWAPAAVLLIGIAIAVIRTVRAKRYAARRT